MQREYRISAANAAYLGVFSVVWLGCIVWFLIPDVRQGVAITAALVLLGLAPGLVAALQPYRVTLSELGELEFHSLLRRRRLRVHQIRELKWDEDSIDLVYDGGRVGIYADKNFKELLARILELNPAIRADDEARALIAGSN